MLDEAGNEVPDGTPGTLYVRGNSAATGYWCRYDTSRQVFQGEWLRTGDTYIKDADGYYACLGRTGDMLKPSGIWVSPAEVEARLLAHEAVAQAVVVAAHDADGLEKPVAFVILQPGQSVTEAELIEFCRQGLPSVKRPARWCSPTATRPRPPGRSAALSCAGWPPPCSPMAIRRRRPSRRERDPMRMASMALMFGRAGYPRQDP